MLCSEIEGMKHVDEATWHLRQGIHEDKPQIQIQIWSDQRAIIMPLWAAIARRNEDDLEGFIDFCFGHRRFSTRVEEKYREFTGER